MAVYKNKKINSDFYIQKKHLNAPQLIIIGVITILFPIILALSISALVSNPENLTKSRLQELASNYYENFIYEKISSANDSGNFNQTMEKYSETGFSAVHLRQLIYFASEPLQKSANYLKSHCDENKTSVKFYPEYPYTKKSYRTEYLYSCDFK